MNPSSGQRGNLKMRSLDDLRGDVCPGCGAPLPDERHPHRRYCSRACYAREFRGMEKQARREARGVRHCATCGEEIDQGRPVGTLYCSRRCSRKASHRRRTEVHRNTTNARRRANYLAKSSQRLKERQGRLCAACGGPIGEDRNMRAKFCSEACGEQHRENLRRARVVQRRHGRVCKCGTPIAGEKNSRALYCSRSCRWKAYYERHHERLISAMRERRQKVKLRCNPVPT